MNQGCQSYLSVSGQRYSSSKDAIQQTFRHKPYVERLIMLSLKSENKN